MLVVLAERGELLFELTFFLSHKVLTRCVNNINAKEDVKNSFILQAGDFDVKSINFSDKLQGCLDTKIK